MASNSLTAAELDTLSSKAIAAKSSAYCPYSKFQVGASLLTEDGTFFVGGNVENASYPVGICAEKNVFSTAVVAGHRKFKAAAVATNTSPAASPCGSCRQFMREFCPSNFPVYLYDKDGRYVVRTIEELLPDSFGPDDLA
ncbi:hypothetical protein LOZ58_002545 [Ophidiomyces ophidiicola]|nr:hypothetical protein LOZ58_002545 [Ophidiomyces ophidiicola]